MTLYLLRKQLKSFTLAFITVCAVTACQPDQAESEATAETPPAPLQAYDSTQAQGRPAADFYIIPPEDRSKRVVICDDEALDTFHAKHDCEKLSPCHGTWRNVTLSRAIENYGRYNCEICSPEYALIFDEDAIRINTGPR